MSRQNDWVSQGLERGVLRRARQLADQLNAKPAPERGAAKLEQYPQGDMLPIQPGEFSAAEAATQLPQTASGSSASASHYSDFISTERRVVTGTETAQQIKAVVGGDAVTPFRLVAPLNGDGLDAMMADAGAADTGAVSHPPLRNEAGETAVEQPYQLLTASTGSGFVTPEGVNAAEELSHGQVATYTMAYNTQPSVESLPQAEFIGAKRFDEALVRVNTERLRREQAGLPGAKEVCVLGESLANSVVWHAIKDHLGEISDPHSTHYISRMLLTGVPAFVPFLEKVIPEGKTLSEDGLWMRVDGSKDPATWQLDHDINGHTVRARYLIMNNPTDPVPRMISPKKLAEIAIHKPEDWQPEVSWRPVLTSAQMVFGIGGAVHIAPGNVGCTGHNYTQYKVPAVARTFFDDVAPQTVDWCQQRMLQAAADSVPAAQA